MHRFVKHAALVVATACLGSIPNADGSPVPQGIPTFKVSKTAIKDPTMLTADAKFECILRGRAFIKQRNFEPALDEFNKALQIDPAYGQALAERGMANFALSRYETAIPDLSLALKLTDDRHLRVSLYLARANSLFETGHAPQALADFTNAIKSDSSDPLPYFQRGSAFCQLRECAKAIADYSRYVKLCPYDPDGFSSRARAYAMLGLNSLAEKDYKQARITSMFK